MTSSSSAQKDKKITFSSFSKSFKKSSACCCCCCCWNSIAKACICCCCWCCCCCCCNTCKKSLCFFCNSKFDCLVYEMLYIKDIKPSLNTQADSIRAKLFTWHFRTFFLNSFFSYCVSYLGNYTHWTSKYFMYCFKFCIFVLHLVLFHFSTW